MQKSPATRPSVLVHGGAGLVDESRLQAALEGCEAAALAGSKKLSEGPLAAAVAAVVAMEENPAFNAGLGATLTRDGTVELDAAVMTGDLRFGGVGACPPVESAIRLALAVLEDGEHGLLTGEGAASFAVHHGFKLLDAEALITDRVRAQLAAEKAKRRAGAATVGAGTVGAVAVGADGKVAAATSTGGILYKRRGRVGDTPLLGAGTYADDISGGAASATGHGEAIMRVLLCKTAVDGVAYGATAEEAGARAMEMLTSRVQGKGGLILIDKNGDFFAGFNTEHMPWAVASTTGVAASGS